MHANDTDVITLCICYYASTLRTQLDKLWVKTGPLSYLPIHEIAKSLRSSQCKLLPFLYSFSVRDTTCHLYFTSKTGWFTVSTKVNTSALEAFGENGQFGITEDLPKQARDLMISIYAENNAILGMSLSDARANKFLTNKATLLQLLPLTENVFMLHLRCAICATIINKTAHVAKPNHPNIEDYGWALKDEMLAPVPVTEPLWPRDLCRQCHVDAKKVAPETVLVPESKFPASLAASAKGHQTDVQSPIL